MAEPAHPGEAPPNYESLFLQEVHDRNNRVRHLRNQVGFLRGIIASVRLADPNHPGKSGFNALDAECCHHDDRAYAMQSRMSEVEMARGWIFSKEEIDSMLDDIDRDLESLRATIEAETGEEDSAFKDLKEDRESSGRRGLKDKDDGETTGFLGRLGAIFKSRK